MYGAIWRGLPGPWPVKLLILLAILAALVWVLIQWVYPWVDTFLPDLLPQDEELGVSTSQPTP
ncbi:hypothetical protein [uncultured Gulosibacter sp.]|uniref:hypothetical protein n=1 Tax=uncultured Gulosibacter sp. TaxID=1339167 RepID=UPI00288B614E|nr:hypothetical protein [uncultured Gulosibacter sp.]